MPNQGIKITSKVTSFEDVQKSLQSIEKQLNSLLESVNNKNQVNVSDKEGIEGDIRTTRNSDKTFTFEVKTKEGWKTPVIGNSAISFKENPALISKSQKKWADYK